MHEIWLESAKPLGFGCAYAGLACMRSPGTQGLNWEWVWGRDCEVVW